jgi:RNA polymerase sigma factor (sigma-70 family)
MDFEPRHDELLRRARAGGAGSTEALTTLLSDLGTVVRQRIATKISPAWRAVLDEDDVMQTTYLEAVLKLDRFVTGGPKEFLNWLTRLAENNLIDAVRAMESAKRPDPRKRVAQGGNPDESAVALIDMLSSGGSTASRVVGRGEAAALLDLALKRLPPDYERVIRQYDLAGRSAGEVAREMGRSEGAVFMLRARAHEQLAELMGSDSKFFSQGS